MISTDGSDTIHLGNTGLCLAVQGDGETNGDNVNVMSCAEKPPKTQQVCGVNVCVCVCVCVCTCTGSVRCSDISFRN